MSSVTQIALKTEQPHGGFLPMKLFQKEVLEDDFILNEEENIHASLVGLAVDYLTRFMLEGSVDSAFHIAYRGAVIIGMQDIASILKGCITGLDDLSITSACKLAGFDVCYRSSPSAYKPIEEINPDAPTIENIRIMVKRSIAFWDKYGPIVCSEPTFEGGYTDTVDAGDGDFLTYDTLWDFKVSKSAPTTKHSLQILMYYIMGKHSVHSYFTPINKLGFYNPRLNKVYICPIASIPTETIISIEDNVLRYGVSARKAPQTVPVNAATTRCAPVYTIADICRMTGIKKQAVYNDIHTGKLRAHKKGNKYCISKEDYSAYIEHIKLQQKIIAWTTIVLLIITVLLFAIIIPDII